MLSAATWATPRRISGDRVRVRVKALSMGGWAVAFGACSNLLNCSPKLLAVFLFRRHFNSSKPFTKC